MSEQEVVIAARGGRALEERLLDDLAATVAADRADLSRPVILVVPSATLRRHLQVRIAKRLGPAVLGLQVQLVGHVAADVLRRARIKVPRGAPLFDVLARRAAADRAPLRQALSPLEDGFGVAAASIRDLLSAGLDSESAPAAHRALPSGADRARALVEAAEDTGTRMARGGYGRRADAMRAAATALEPDTHLLGARAVLVYGFADAPGATTAFIRSLLRHPGARLYVDRAPDPADASRGDAGVRFVDRFLTRLGRGDAAHPDSSSPGPARAPLAAFSASGADGEAREIAHRVRQHLDDGVAPEDIAIVARRLDRHAAVLRRHLRALAIPFSGGALPAAWSPAQRRVDAILDLLRARDGALTDRWLEARRGRARESDLRLAFRVLGCTRLGVAARLDVNEWLGDKDSLPLPARRGLRSASGGDENDEASTRSRTAPVYNERRRVARSELEKMVELAGQTHALLLEWPVAGTLGEHVAHARKLSGLLRLQRKGTEQLGPVDRALAGRWKEALQQIEELDASFEATVDEFRLLLEHALSRGWEPLGGRGSGVQVLDVIHARALTFDHLFVMGLERDVFPRTISEDPLLPDRHRARLASVLPDLATGETAHAEERLLFASLIGAATHATLSWQRSDEDGRELAPSPFVERLRQTGKIEVEAVPRAISGLVTRRPGTAREAALAEALSGPRARFRALLPLALREGRALHSLPPEAQQALPAPDTDVLARVRLRVLDAFDPDRATVEGRRLLRRPSPWFGAIGRLRSGATDPRLNDLHVTALENLARCPWRMFLSRDLNLERPPDPLAGPPEFSKLLIGNVVHETLEALIRSALPSPRCSELASAIEQGATTVARPDDAAIREELERAARRCARIEGLHLPGLHAALVVICRPYVDRALDVDWHGEPVSVLGVELSGEVTLDVEGRPVTLRFKADRADSCDDGSTRLTDYKTGKTISEAKTRKTLEKHLAEKIRAGTHLQAAAYARSAGGACGRYLYVKDDLDDAHREFIVTAEGPNAEAFEATARALFAARAGGIMFPRLGDGQGGQGAACRWCEHLEACVQQDSGMKLRLERIAQQSVEAARRGEDQPTFERHLARLWQVDQEDVS